MYGPPRSTPSPGAPGGPVRLPPGTVARPPRPKYPGVRFLASSCIVSAWLTLILSLVGGVVMIASSVSPDLTPAPQRLSPSPISGLDDAGTSAEPRSSQSEAMLALMNVLLPSIKVGSGILTIATGVVTFFLLLALGMLMYVLLDMEQNTRSAAAAMSAIAQRMGLTGM